LSGGHVGFDLFDKTNFGATDFAQQVNFRRAIEGELAKTLEGMDELDAARVHITPKKESVFTEKEEGSKASVMLRVRQGKELSDERTEAIVSLISSSVEGLDPRRSIAHRRERRGEIAQHRIIARAVGAMPWPLRTTRSSPSVSRRRRSALLTAGWLKDKLRAARVRLRSAITSSNTRSKFRSRVRKLAAFMFVIYHLNE